jgi:hypothetical protein
METDAAFNIFTILAIRNAGAKLTQGGSGAKTVEQMTRIPEFGQRVFMRFTTLALENNRPIPGQAMAF